MKILQLEQGSQEWLDIRKVKITSTDASSICEVNPFKNGFDLWLEKTGRIPPTQMNDRMRRGQELEEPARNLLIENLGINFTPRVCLHDVEYWAMASLDGLSDCGRFVCEIKAPSEKTHNLSLKEIIQTYYYCQCQHHLWVTGAEICYYFSYNPDAIIKGKIIEILPDKKYIEDMVLMEKMFYEENMLQDSEPTLKLVVI